MICQQAIAPGSKLQTVRALSQSTLGSALGVADADEDDLYAALDWLLDRQERIEDRLARRHLADGELVLYDVSSSYFEGRSVPAGEARATRATASAGRCRSSTGCCVTGRAARSPSRSSPANCTTTKRCPPDRQAQGAVRAKRTVIVVADRGMVTKANLELMAETDGVGWITALKAPQIKKLVSGGTLQLSLFDEHNLAEITAPEDYPGERLIVCRNPLVAAERTRKRDRTARRDRARPPADRRPRHARHAVRRRPDRPRGRAGAQAPPDEKTLRHRDHRHQLHL